MLGHIPGLNGDTNRSCCENLKQNVRLCVQLGTSGAPSSAFFEIKCNETDIAAV